MANDMILPDSLAQGLKLVFCGTAASDVSARERAYYANPSNAFWRTLHQIGLTPRPYVPQEFPDLLALGIGFTDLAKQAKGTDDKLTKSDFDRAALSAKIDQFQPKILAFTSKKAAATYFDLPTRKINYGPQDKQQGRTRFWVLTSPSGAARAYWDLSVWQALADAITANS